MKKIKVLIMIFASIALLTACGSNDDSADAATKKSITVGTSPGPYSELFIDAIIPILEADGYEIETIDFSELLQADIALDEGSIDLNVDQHTAYYANFNEEKGANLTKLTPIPTVPTGLYPGRKDDLSHIKAGDKIGIPKDPSNAARAYALLQKAELIELEDDVELIKASKNSIKTYNKDIEIFEMDSAQIPRALDDLDYAVIPGSIVYSSGLDAATSLINEDILKDLELVAVVDEKNKESDWAKAVIAAYESDEFKAYMDEHNKDGYWFIPEDIR